MGYNIIIEYVNSVKIRNAKVVITFIFKEITSYFPLKLSLIQHSLLSFKCIKQVKRNLASSQNAVVLKTSAEQCNSLHAVHKHYASLLHLEGCPLQPQHNTTQHRNRSNKWEVRNCKLVHVELINRRHRYQKNNV